MNDLTQLMTSVLREAVQAMIPDIVKEIRQEERMRLAKEFDIAARPLFTKKEVAKHFKVSERSVEHWHKLLPAELKPIQIEGTTRYSMEHVQFLESLHLSI